MTTTETELTTTEPEETTTETTTTTTETKPIAETVVGDANGDGKLNVRDAANIAYMLATGKVDQLPEEADFNGDGKINVRDAAAIAKFLASGKTA